MNSIKKLCMAMGVASIAMSAYAVDGTTPKWLRNTAISPDGKEIAFTYKGDIFISPVKGGTARQLTSGNAYDTAPVWSPDSKTIVFASSREGGMDLYAIPAQGGDVRRITTAYP